MPSSLITHDAVSFVVARNFSSNGKDFHVGEDFDPADTEKIEVMVRARYVIPVVESPVDTPRYWHRTVQTKADVLARLMREDVQIVLPQAPDSVDMDPIVDPNRGSEVAPAEVAASESPESGEPFDPADHTVVEVREYLAEHPDDTERVLALEAEGRARKGLLEE